MTLRQLLGIELPIVQAPMAGSQDSALAVEVSNAGGLGSIPAAMLSHDGLRREIATLTSRANGPYNVNFFCHTPSAPDAQRDEAWQALLAPYYDELGITPSTITGPSRAPFDADAAAIVTELRPPVVSFHFGLPSAALVQQVKASGATIMATATTVDEARWLDAHGADVIIAQGYEAGGHRGCFLSLDVTTQVGTFALLPRILKAVARPIVAAGGIADAAGVRAALALGASAVQLGTTYLLCPEARTSAVHRAALADDRAPHTALTNLFSGRPARGIMNRLMRDLGPLRTDVPAFPTASAALAPLRAKAEADGSGDFSPLWSGQNASGCRTIGAGDLTRDLAR